MKLIGIAGTNGSGKDTVGHVLAEEYGFLFISVSDLLRDEARKRGLPVTREVLRTISAEWRRDFGLGVLVDKAVEAFNASGTAYAGLVATPMRNVGEAQHLKDLGGTLVWVDADQRTRYERIQRADRGRAGEDDKTFEQFAEEELAEMHPSGDEATLHLAGVKAISDVFMTNDGDDVDAFKTEVATALKELGLV